MAFVRPGVLVGASVLSSAVLFGPDIATLQPGKQPFTAISSVVRSTRTFTTVAIIAADYKWSLRGLDATADPDEFKRVISSCHRRTAQRMLSLCSKNSGVYVKAGQHVASLRPAVPAEITTLMATLNDRAPQSSLELVKEVINEGLQGAKFEDVFSEFDEKPVGCASLAQVHRGRLAKTGEEVAVKVQHAHLKHTFPSDTLTLRWALKLCNVLFPAVDLMWVLPTFEDNLKKELNFTLEIENSKRCAKNFASYPWVHVPFTHDSLSSSRVLVMEFVHGVAVDNKTAIEEMGYSSTKVADMMAQLFSEMIFSTGFVHCDPHPGNVLVRHQPYNPSPSKLPQLVLLDHGLYREIPEQIRVDYCELWEAMILQDEKRVISSAEALGMGEYANKLPLLFVGRAINDKTTKLGEDLSREQRRKLIKELGISRATALQDVTTFMERFPRDLLFALRAQNLVRGVHETLGGSRGKRFVTFARAALKGRAITPSRTLSTSTFVWQLFVNLWRRVNFELRLCVSEWAIDLRRRFA